MKKVKKEEKLDVVFILDKSGSMAGQVENTISSFNEYLEKEKKNKYETNISTVLFSDKYTVLHDRVNVSKVKPLTNKEYYVEGCTALYDALGNTIHSFEAKDTDKVIFIIITDGYENASKEYKNEDIKKLVKGHDDYEFIYVGADIDSYVAGSNIGIRRSNIANFKKGKVGTGKLFNAITCFEECVMGDSEANWKEELEEYIDENMQNRIRR
jgi:hypothetical protein